MSGHPWSSRRSPAAAAVAVLVLAGLQLLPAAPGWAAPVAGTLTGSPSGPVVAGERVRLTGQLPPAKARPVVLQSRRGTAAWVRVAAGRSTAAGRFAFRVTTPARVGVVLRYRVVARAVRLAGTRYPARQTPTVTYRTVAPTAVLTTPELATQSLPYAVSARFTPARRGRPVVLEKLVGTTWHRVAQGVEGAGGAVTFDVTAGSVDSETWRVWALSDGGAARVGTEPGTVPLVPRVDAGSYHTCQVRADGTAWCWGWNIYGQLGNGTSTDSDTQVQVGVDTDWAGVAAGQYHSCGLKVDGTLWCWGDNSGSQLGQGTDSGLSRTPLQVGGNDDWTQVTATGRYTCGLRADGTAWCWGENTLGQLGDGTTDERSVPTQVGTGSDWAQLAAGDGHTCGVRTDGTAWCWGYNYNGQLGDDSTTSSPEPVPVGTATDWAGVAAWGGVSCGVRTDGTAWCWGFNGNGQLGIGVGADRHTPAQVGTDTDWLRLSVGGYHVCGTRGNGTAWCWGLNNYGSLGDGTGAASTTPVRVDGPADWSGQVTAGSGHACASRAAGTLWCWGLNNFGQVGDGSVVNQGTPIRVLVP